MLVMKIEKIAENWNIKVKWNEIQNLDLRTTYLMSPNVSDKLISLHFKELDHHQKMFCVPLQML